MEYGITLLDGINPIALSPNITSKAPLIVRPDEKAPNNKSHGNILLCFTRRGKLTTESKEFAIIYIYVRLSLAWRLV